MTTPVSTPDVFKPEQSVSIVGLGNVFLGDDGFGPLAVETFRCLYQCGSNVEVLDLGTPGLDLAPYLYGRKLVIIIDTVDAIVPPGKLSMFCEEDFDSTRASLRITGHDPALWDTLMHLRLADCGPTELIVMGVSSESCCFGEGMSDGMLSLASEAAEAVAKLLACRGLICVRRHPAAMPNLWWLPLAVHESASRAKANVNA